MSSITASGICYPESDIKILRSIVMRCHPKFFLSFLLLVIFFCTEKIPEGPERTEILDVKLFIEDGRTEFAQETNWENRFKLPPKQMTLGEYEALAQWKVPFGLWAFNDFDEAIDGKKWIKIRVNLWSADEADEWTAQLVYADTTSTRNMTIPPGDSITIYTGDKLVWNQHDDAEKSIHHTNLYTPLWVDCTVFDSVFKRPDTTITWRYCDTTMLAPVDTVIAFDLPKIVKARAEVQLFQNYHIVQSNMVEFKIHYFFPSEGFKNKFWCPEGRVMIGDPPCPFGK